MNIVRALRFHAELPIELRGECMLTAAYLINRTPTNILKGKTPYECLFEIPPCYENIRVFGCLGYAKFKDRIKDKFAPRSRRCVFVGYPFGKKGWKLYDLESKIIFVSRDVEFYEEKFPYSHKTIENSGERGSMRTQVCFGDEVFKVQDDPIMLGQDTCSEARPIEDVRPNMASDTLGSSTDLAGHGREAEAVVQAQTVANSAGPDPGITASIVNDRGSSAQQSKIQPIRLSR